MTESLPAPLTPADCDLRDFADYMPLEVAKLRDSDMAATPDAEVFRAAVLSWCVAWHQVPAASLPDDDAAIARLIGMGRDVAGMAALRASGALRGFVKCTDGRLYHPLIAERAINAMEAKRQQRHRTAKARETVLSHRQSQKSVTESVTELEKQPNRRKVKVSEGEEDKKVTSGVASPPPAVVVPEFIRLPTNRFETKAEEVAITENFVEENQQLFQAVDVRGELRKMRAWLLANKELRKTRKGMTRFVNAWLGRQQDRVSRETSNGGRNGGQSSSPSFGSGVARVVEQRAARDFAFEGRPGAGEPAESDGEGDDSSEASRLRLAHSA